MGLLKRKRPHKAGADLCWQAGDRFSEYSMRLTGASSPTSVELFRVGMAGSSSCQ